jgi:signal transduction histidine kinase
VIIHPDDLAEAIGGLVENAARHALTRVVISCRREEGMTALCITDDGPGIPDEYQADALARGHRLDVTKPGTGLGLAIVSDIASAWGGTIQFERDGPLFSVVLRLRSA